MFAAAFAADKDLGLGGIVLVLVVDIQRDDNVVVVTVGVLDNLDEVVTVLLTSAASLRELAVHGILELVVSVLEVVATVQVTSLWVRREGQVLQGASVLAIDTVCLDGLSLALRDVSIVEPTVSLGAFGLTDAPGLFICISHKLSGVTLNSSLNSLLDLEMVEMAINTGTLSALQYLRRSGIDGNRSLSFLLTSCFGCLRLNLGFL